MLTINLIPKSFYERRIVRQLFFSFIGLWVLIAAGMVAMTLMTQAKIDKANADLQAVEPIAQQVESLQKQASDKRSEVAPIMAKVKYINDVMAYNTAMIPILQEVIRYTYKTITYTSIQPSGNTLTIQGWCPSTVDARRSLMGLYRATPLLVRYILWCSGIPHWRRRHGSGGGRRGCFAGRPAWLFIYRYLHTGEADRCSGIQRSRRCCSGSCRSGRCSRCAWYACRCSATRCAGRPGRTGRWGWGGSAAASAVTGSIRTEAEARVWAS